MRKYICKKNIKGEIKQVFEGTLEEALNLQKDWGVDEEDYINCDNFNQLLENHYFGTDSDYKEVSQEDYIKIGKNTTLQDEKNEIWEKY